MGAHAPQSHSAVGSAEVPAGGSVAHQRLLERFHGECAGVSHPKCLPRVRHRSRGMPFISMDMDGEDLSLLLDRQAAGDKAVETARKRA